MPDYEAMRKEIKAFDETKDLDVQDHELLTVLQYIELKKAFDPNDVSIKFEPYLETDPFIQINYRRSKAYEIYEKKKEQLNQIDTFYHNDYLIDASLSDFSVYNDERQKVYELASKFVSEFQKGQFIKGLYLYGKYRTGKTFVLSAIANQLIDKNVSIVFAYFPDLVRHMKAAIGDRTLEQKIKQLKTCDLLVLDDVGGEYMTAWFRDEVFGPILQYRLSMGLPLLVSSNYKLSNLHVLLSDTKDDIDKVKSMRILTRIKELTQEIELSMERYNKN
ncbi:MAG: ATP-binding protein [Acholeplasma sp.]|nr:ATP-binding protein [Acholeplasma sp.]